MKHVSNTIAWCTLCNQGWLEIKKEKQTNNLFIICSECDTAYWSIPQAIENKDAFLYVGDVSEEATMQEIEAHGWDVSLLVT